MFYKISIKDWSEALFINTLLNHISPIWAFRGQADSTWSLETTFEREGKKHNLNPYYYKTCESNIITDFKRQASQHIQNKPDDDNYVDWIAYIQHYGGPTRLLDFTYSFYVAAFFSMKSVKSNPSIWCFNINNLIKQNKQYHRLLFESGYRKTLYKCVADANISIEKKQDFSGKKKLGNVLLVEPYNQEQRLGIQQGLFLFPTEIELSFEANLSNAFSVDAGQLSPQNIGMITAEELSKKDSQLINCVQIVFENPTVIYEAISQLKSMNISYATLFPGLDGFAKSLEFHFHDMYWSINNPKKIIK